MLTLGARCHAQLAIARDISRRSRSPSPPLSSRRDPGPRRRTRRRPGDEFVGEWTSDVMGDAVDTVTRDGDESTIELPNKTYKGQLEDEAVFAPFDDPTIVLAMKGEDLIMRFYKEGNALLLKRSRVGPKPHALDGSAGRTPSSVGSADTVGTCTFAVQLPDIARSTGRGQRRGRASRPAPVASHSLRGGGAAPPRRAPAPPIHAGRPSSPGRPSRHGPRRSDLLGPPAARASTSQATRPATTAATTTIRTMVPPLEASALLLRRAAGATSA